MTTLAEQYEQLNNDQRQQLAQRAGVDPSLLVTAARSPDCAGWLQIRIADRLGQPRRELFPGHGRYDDRRDQFAADERLESWLRRSRQAASQGGSP